MHFYSLIECVGSRNYMIARRHDYMCVSYFRQQQNQTRALLRNISIMPDIPTQTRHAEMLYQLYTKPHFPISFLLSAAYYCQTIS